MFQALRYRLLLSYLLVLASILSVFAIAVRVVFTQSLTQQLTAQLRLLGQGAAANAVFNQKQGRIIVGKGFSTPELIARERAIQWFDLQGHLITQQGKAVLALPLPASTEDSVQIQASQPRVQGVTLPILDKNDRQPVGYVRVSKSLAEQDERLQRLDLGLGGGIFVALILSGVGGIWLTRQAMLPIEENFRRLKQFTADASHELRSPLMAIKTNVSVALKYPNGMRPADAEKFEAIASATTQMVCLTEDLLLLVRTDQTPGRDRETVNLASMLADLIQLYQSPAAVKQVELKSELSTPIDLLGDASQLNRLFTNLIINALDYTPPGGTVEIQASQVGQTIFVKVQDTGIGIAPENLERIFHRFWRGDQSRTYSQGGSGLGLAIAQAIAQSHNGQISVTSELGQGSCFTVQFKA
ncbi:MAG: HAMP domain-containing histidine kinase [Aphanocapsa sp. GSE-SYN-MK-11-07L]|nr:HAMP domain-containing histidine kinase [Aphanocapsa sp. GSE-SYN-MK-11-07L]